MNERYHFIGAGGIGMSSLARLLLHDGVRVSGSDRSDSPMLDHLRELGMAAFVGHDPAHVPEDAVVVISDAITDENPEMAAAVARGQKVIRRSELLGQLMERRRGIAVAGTHGKTSTTAMLACIMLENGLDPSVMVGGEALGKEGNAHAGSGEYFVAEACEAFESYLYLKPEIGIITNIESDHLHHHGTFAHLLDSFTKFVSAIEPGGVLVANAEDEHVRDVARRYADGGGRVETFGFEAGRWRAANITVDGLETEFDVLDGEAVVARARLRVPGRHNVANALAALAAAVEAGVPAAAAAASLASYRGVARRFDFLGERAGVKVYDDYAHHPTEVAATLRAAREAFQGREDFRLVAVFQPHLFSRTRDHLCGFIEALDLADVVILTDIYASREEPLEGINSSRIVEGIRERSPSKELYYIPGLADVPAAMDFACRRGDVAIVIGAGDIRMAGERFVALPEPAA